MKKSFLLAGLLFMLSFTISAQQSKGVFLHKQQTMDALGLNKEQQVQIATLTSKSFADIKKIRQDTAFSESDKKSKISSVYRNRQKEYEKALTPEQLKKYNELKEAAKAQ